MRESSIQKKEKNIEKFVLQREGRLPFLFLCYSERMPAGKGEAYGKVFKIRRPPGD